MSNKFYLLFIIVSFSFMSLVSCQDSPQVGGKRKWKIDTIILNSENVKIYHYDSLGRIKSTVDSPGSYKPDNIFYRYTRDSVIEEFSSGLTIKYILNDKGLVVAADDGSRYTYDDKKYIKSIKYISGVLSEFNYLNDDLVSITNFNGYKGAKGIITYYQDEDKVDYAQTFMGQRSKHMVKSVTYLGFPSIKGVEAYSYQKDDSGRAIKQKIYREKDSFELEYHYIN